MKLLPLICRVIKQFQYQDEAPIRGPDHTASVRRSRRGRDPTSDTFGVLVTSGPSYATAKETSIKRDLYLLITII